MERDQEAAEMRFARVGVDHLGKYRVIAELARGGMGVVHLAIQRRPGSSTRLLVLKELRPELLEEPVVLAMFMQEARLAARLDHPNVVRTFEVGTDGARHYIAMEYLDGQPLHRVLSRARRGGTKVPLELHGAVICSALEGLAYAHAAVDAEGAAMGIVHRDMNPQSVFVCYDGQVKVLDFGIAKIIDSAVETRAGILKGKVPYMAPEQAAGTQVDARADVFAVGVMLWEAATGRRFWSGVGNDAEILRTMAEGKLSAEHDGAMDNVHEELRAVILKATALDPGMRHSSAAELLIDLRAALAQRRSPPLTQQEIGRFIAELFVEDRARLQMAIGEALRSQTQMASGSYLVSDVHSPSVRGDRLESAALLADASPAAPVMPLVAMPQGAPFAVHAPNAVRQMLLASSDEIGAAVGRLQESESVAALPRSVEVIVRAVHAVGGHDVATSLEALSDCMEVVQALDQWRVSVARYLRSLEPSDSVTELIDFEPVDAEPTGKIAALSSHAPAAIEAHAPVVAETAPPLEAFSPSPAAKGPRLVAWAVLGALAVLGVTASILAMGRVSDPPRASASIAPVLQTAGSAPPSAEKQSVEKVHVIVRASPAQARIVIDGTLVFENPSVVTFTKDGARHAVRVEAQGYSPRDESFDANGDRTFVLALEPDKAPPRAAAGPRLPAPALVPPAPSPGATSGGLDGSPSDKCYLGRPEKGHAGPAGSADDARSVPHVGLPANQHD
ncbi:MAG: protein kinase [Myxococcota bacterium]|nr:protein kinase [Myxococcota bacterium]